MMKFRTFQLLTCVLVALAVANTASAGNIILNGDFETGDLTGWEVNGAGAGSSASIATPDNGPTLPGTHNAFMNNMGQATGLNLKQVTPVGSVAEGEVDYSFDLKLDQADVGGVLFVEIFAEQEGVGIIGGSGLMGPFWPWNAWETFTGSFTAPAGTDFLTIQFVATTGASEGTSCVAHVDNVIVDPAGSVAAEASTWGDVKGLYR